MSDIYKIAHITEKDNIKNLYVFVGDIDTDYNTLFKKNTRDTIFKTLFTLNEIKDIEKNNTKVFFINETLHIDDTIEVIKKKIIRGTKEFISDKKQFSFNEMYLFMKQREKVNIKYIYQLLTNNNTTEITYNKLFYFLLNSGYEKKLKEKINYDYDDIIELNINNKVWEQNKVIGYNINVESIFSFIINPFQIENQEDIDIHKKVETKNQMLLMDYGNIMNNTIYLCLAEDVLRSMDDILDQNIIEIYYPFLKNVDIDSYDTLMDRKQELLDDKMSNISDILEKNINNVNLFYNIFNKQKSAMKYIETGITNLIFTIHPEYELNIPLDIIFKLIRATEKIPLIKYNPSKRFENQYRLYTSDNITDTGEKIPFLDKSKINKEVTKRGNNNSIMAYINVEDYKYPIYCYFYENGNISIEVNTEQPTMIDNIINKLLTDVNPVIKIVKKFLSQSGYTINLIENLTNKNIEINNMNYKSKITMKQNIDNNILNTIMGCLPSVFIVKQANLKKTATMVFKRVSDFNEYDEIETLILNLLKGNNSHEEIKRKIMENFHLKEEEAKKRINVMINEKLHQIESEFSNKRMTITNNSGFETTLQKEKFTDDIILEIKGIDNIYYTDILPIYISSLFRIIQDRKSINIKNIKNIKNIDDLCKGKIKKQQKSMEAIEEVVIVDKPEENVFFTLESQINHQCF